MDQELSDIERRGLDAATALVDRFASVDRRAAVASDTQATEAVTDRLGRAWAEVVQTTAAAWSATDARPTGRDLDLSTIGAGVVAMTAGVGDHATGTFWIHNPTDDDVDGLRFANGPLWSADASTIPPAAVQIDPVEIDLVPARSSRMISVTVRTPAESDTRAARYRGVVQVEGRAELWALIDLTIA